MKISSSAMLSFIVTNLLFSSIYGFAGDVVINQNTTWSDGVYDCNNLTITSSAILTCSGQVTINADNITIDPGASISADGTGYPAKTGPGTSLITGGAGGYGGYGGGCSGCNPPTAYSGPAYGSMLAPTDLGSGGGGNYSGAGGGALRLSAVGLLQVNGSISANGKGAGATYNGAGSGGSIYITTNEISGSGSISANGGTYQYGSAGGGGGRIAIYSETNTFSGTISACGGAPGSTGDRGGAGTVYIKTSAQNGILKIDNGGLQGASTPLPDSTPVFDQVIVTNKAILELSGTASLQTDILQSDPDGRITVNNGGQLLAGAIELKSGGTLVAQQGAVVTASSLDILSGGILTINGNAQLTPLPTVISAGGTLILNTPYTLPELYIASGGTLTHSAGDNDFNLTVFGDLIIDAGGAVSADGKGFAPKKGPGAGLDSDEGGSYGGHGGVCTLPVKGSGTYGSAAEPDDLGSGGGGNGTKGYGGGAIRLFVDGTLAVEGQITANGANGTNSYCGGGSGGSVFITAKALGGSGVISANGGNGGYSSAGGGGGRVAVYGSIADFQGTMEARAGTLCNAVNGTVVSDERSILTFGNLSQTYTSQSDFSETILIQGPELTDLDVSGDINGVVDFNDLEFVTIQTGSFAGQGMATARIYATIDGADYAADWNAVVFTEQTEQGTNIQIRGTLSGGITGITEDRLTAAESNPNQYSVYQSTWHLNRVGYQRTYLKLSLTGALNNGASAEYSSTPLSLLQIGLQGNCSGDYEGPLSVVLTGIKINQASSPYYGKGFSSMSYISSLGQGRIFTNNKETGPAMTELHGPCDNPLLGILTATLDQTQSPAIFSAQIDRMDNDIEPQAFLQITAWGPRQVSPGETVQYAFEYRNDGAVSAKDVLITYRLPLEVDFISCSGNGEYKRYGDLIGTSEVTWFFDSIAPGTKGVLGATVNAKWGLPHGLDFSGSVFVNEINMPPADPNFSITSTLLHADNSLVEAEYEITDSNGLVGTIEASCLVQESTSAVEPNFVISGTDGNYETYFEFSANPLFRGYVNNMGEIDPAKIAQLIAENPESLRRHESKTVAARITDNQLLNYLKENDFISPETHEKYTQEQPTPAMAKYLIKDLLGKYTDAKDYYREICRDILDRLSTLPKNDLAALIAEHEKQRALQANEDPRIPIDIETVGSEAILMSVLQLYMEGYETKSISYDVVNPVKAPPGLVSRIVKFIKTTVTAAYDPNKKHGPVGKVLPGQKLDYKVEFENEGQGIAFGVYFTDVLDEDVNDQTLQTGPVVDSNTGITLAQPGLYDPATRTITWYVGRVDPNQGGYAQYSVDVNSDAAHGTEIINYATIYFPSVPQQLNTNAIVSTVLLNVPPLADAGPDQTVHVHDLVTLDGSQSSDPDGDLLAFEWKLVTYPQGSTATLNDVNTLNPTLQPDKIGTYTITLAVDDGQEKSVLDVVKISTLNSPPVANAGTDQSVHAGSLVTLDASGSTDVDGDLLQYRWEFVSIPDGSSAVLNEPNSVHPTFVADKPGSFTIGLAVNDGIIDSQPDTVIVSTLNIAPAANAGEDQSVHVGSLVTLDGSASIDADNDILTFLWVFTSIPQDSQTVLENPTSIHPTFIADVSGTYVISLVVHDGTESSLPDTVTISTINVAPTAHAGSDQAVYVGDTVTLDGSGCFDSDGDELSYLWNITSKPAGSQAVLSDSNSIQPAFTVDTAGTYVVSLIVNDGIVNSQPDTVVVSTINVAPIADAGQDQSVYAGQLVTLDGSQSSDPDGDNISWQWAFIQIPQGSMAVLTDETACYPSFVPDIAGLYTLNLVVSDGLLQSQADSVTVSVATSATTAILKVQNIIDTINGFDKHVFKDRLRKKILTRKLNAVVEILEHKRYCVARIILEHDIMKKTDGCAISGRPDRNDWIIDCTAQTIVYNSLQEVIDLLSQMPCNHPHYPCCH